MQTKKFRRKFFRNVPLIFLSFILVFIFSLAVLYFSNLLISKKNSFVSPLANVKSSQSSNLENLLNQNGIQFSKIEGETVFLNGGGTVYLDLGKNLSSQISSLQLILSRLTIEGKKFKKLDLRFDKPIIEF